MESHGGLTQGPGQAGLFEHVCGEHHPVARLRMVGGKKAQLTLLFEMGGVEKSKSEMEIEPGVLTQSSYLQLLTRDNGTKVCNLDWKKLKSTHKIRSIEQFLQERLANSSIRAQYSPPPFFKRAW